MPITSSTFTEGPTQADGRRNVTETHVDDTGAVYKYEWLGAQNVTAVINARASLLNTQLSDRAAAAALVAGTKLPLTKLEFRRRFTSTEQEAVDDFNANYKGNGGLTPAQKRTICTALENLNAAEYIQLSDASTIAGVNLYVSVGIITAARASEILNG